MKIYIEEEDGTTRAPLILVELDATTGPQPLQQVLQRIFAELRTLQEAQHATRPGP